MPVRGYENPGASFRVRYNKEVFYFKLVVIKILAFFRFVYKMVPIMSVTLFFNRESIYETSYLMYVCMCQS